MTAYTPITPALSGTGWIEHDGLSIPVFPVGTLVTLRFADGLTEDRPCSPGFWGNYWLRRYQPGRHINGYRIAARVVVNLPAMMDAVAARRAA